MKPHNRELKVEDDSDSIGKEASGSEDAAFQFEAAECVEEEKNAYLQMHIEDVVNFCFPTNLSHPDSSNRLFTLAEYGPLYREHSYLSCLCLKCQHQFQALKKNHDERATSIMYGEHLTPKHLHEFSWLCEACSKHISEIVHLKSGFKGDHIVSDGELEKMCFIILQDDLMSVFGMDKGFLTPLEKEMFIRTLDPCLQHPINVTEKEIRKLLQPLVNNDMLPFGKASRVIREYRFSRNVSFKDSDFSVKEANKQYRVKIGRRRPVLKRRDKQVPTESFERISKLLHQHAFEITAIDAPQSNDVVQNVNVLVDRCHDAETEWDSNFGIRAASQGRKRAEKKIVNC